MLWFSQKSEIEELRRRVDKLETASRQLDLEWSSTYDKFRSILARIAKRQERADATDVDASGSQGPTELPTLVGPSLDTRRNQINQKILDRRARIGGR